MNARRRSRFKAHGAQPKTPDCIGQRARREHAVRAGIIHHISHDHSAAQIGPRAQNRGFHGMAGAERGYNGADMRLALFVRHGFDIHDLCLD